ncbi:hypothetical protein [Salmonirosea aquatica]|uniref:Uncharacterized protein n=1 Tax=Salmonirosea aquatica TaxID=2654236 RepID=A0A7C9BEJ8_9BACT|nr:hypothetical protein [Cytophagaceae bacterium SJW1-29]
MKALLLSTVREFFRQRAGFFLVGIFLIFGFLTSREHYAFAMFFLTDDWGMLTLFVVWGGYILLCAQFIAHQWLRPEYVFLHNVRLWPFGRRLYRLSVMALGFIQPLLLYGIYVLSIARQEKILGSSWPLLVYWLILYLALVVVTEWRLRNPDVASSARKSGVRLPFKRPAHMIFWTLEWLLRERGLTLLLTKVGALLFVTATLVYDHTGDYDLRLPAIGFTLAYLMNIGLSQELFEWDNQIWLWGKSLPISQGKRFLNVLILHAILILPETFVAVRGDTLGSLSAWEWVQVFGLGLACLLLHHVRLYRKSYDPEKSSQSLLVGYLVLTFLILYSVPVWALGVVLLGWSMWMWYGGLKGRLPARL